LLPPARASGKRPRVTSPAPAQHPPDALSRPAALVRRHDPDRFLTALFAPAERREALLLLYAFNHELARAREAVSKPTLALVRLQWWREVVAGAVRHHDVAEPLAAALASGTLPRDALLGLIEAREIETEPAIPDRAAWRDYLLGTAGALAVLAGGILDAPASVRERLALLGAAYGVAGTLRSLAAQARLGRCLLPADALAEHGLSVEGVIAAPEAPALGGVFEALAAEGREMLREAGSLRLPRRAIAAALPAVLARRDLRQPGPAPRARGLADRLAVAAAAFRGEIGP